MREQSLLDVWRLVWLLCLVLATSLAQTSQVCPSHSEIAPCYCSVKKSGLDIVCEITDLQHISKAMAVLKGRPNLVIFYLRLRHNNLPKLQGYVFLGLDIRHLTIHNSSLAVLEESSLSSIGECTNDILLTEFNRNISKSRERELEIFTSFSEKNTDEIYTICVSLEYRI